jgi:integrase
MPLTDVKIRQARAGERSIKLTDGGGLYLEVRPTGAKLWRYRYRIGGRENVFALGEYPSISLGDARKARDGARELVRRGVHPAHARREAVAGQVASNAVTFEAIAREWMASQAGRWSARYASDVARGLEQNAFPAFGALPIRSVTAALVLSLIQKMAKRGAETYAQQVRQWVSAVFRFAVATLRAEYDPASALRGAVAVPQVEHAQAMPRHVLAEFRDALPSYTGHPTTRIALQILLYTFVRTAELRRARWDQFDLTGARWDIPAGNMKRRRPHIVPLSRQVVDLLGELYEYTGAGNGYLLPNMRRPADGCMSHTTINHALRRMGFAQWSGHDFRATASTHLYEMGRYRGDVIELQLAHVEGNKTKAAYNHARYMSERVQMMQEWADWVDGVQAD